MQEVSKPFWQSKTILVQILGALAVLVGIWNPVVGEWMKTNLVETSSIWIMLNVVLRFITKDSVSIS